MTDHDDYYDIIEPKPDPIWNKDTDWERGFLIGLGCGVTLAAAVSVIAKGLGWLI